MSQKWSKEEIESWSEFWKKDSMAKRIISFIEEIRDGEMGIALASGQSPCNGAAIQEHVIKAAGIDLVIQSIIATTKQ